MNELTFDFNENNSETVISTIEKQETVVVNEEGELDLQIDFIITHSWTLAKIPA